MSARAEGPALVVLAAGLGTRFGGDKQTTPLGPGGTTLLEYDLFDALASGFGRVVVVVRAEMRAAMETSLEGWLSGRAEFATAVQERDPSRAKPWGTGHAVLAARSHITGPFAVANADDLYGRAAFQALGEFLRTPHAATEQVLIGFRLGDTLAPAGAVNRALCEAGADGLLTRITERTGLTREAAEREGILEAPVSMNLWGFTPAIVELLARGFAEFHARASGNEEYLLPDAVQACMAAGEIHVRLLRAASAWCGVTHRADAPRVRAELEARVARGEYPRALWE